MKIVRPLGLAIFILETCGIRTGCPVDIPGTLRD
jgi:hypothetical protein